MKTSDEIVTNQFLITDHFNILQVSSSLGGILAPTSPFLHSPGTAESPKVWGSTLAQQNILSLLADRTHDLWSKANMSQAGIPIPALPPAAPPHPPPPVAPPIFPFAALATANVATPPTPPLLPLSITPSWDSIQETTARLLFMAVRWVKCLVPFQTLSVRDQVCTYFNFVFKYFLIIRDHSSITSSKRWVGGVRKWQEVGGPKKVKNMMT